MIIHFMPNSITCARLQKALEGIGLCLIDVGGNVHMVRRDPATAAVYAATAKQYGRFTGDLPITEWPGKEEDEAQAAEFRRYAEDLEEHRSL